MSGESQTRRTAQQAAATLLSWDKDNSINRIGYITMPFKQLKYERFCKIKQRC